MRTYAQNSLAQDALHLLTDLQSCFKEKLTDVANSSDKLTNNSISTTMPFKSVDWLRDEGKHGGGTRFEAVEGGMFNRASINVSQIHYEDSPEKHYDSATALSTIIHPKDPLSPSIHMHYSLTILKDGSSYWRIMADLNPSHFNKDDKEYFDQTLKVAAKDHYSEGAKLGNQYFDIPALNKRRGVSHFYLEGFNPKNEDGAAFTNQFATKVIDTYIDLLSLHSVNIEQPTEAQQQKQLDYHTLYFYQVLTLDKGTTAGLLIHNQNDVGTLGSLPSHINRDQLSEWEALSPEPIKSLVTDLLAVLPKQTSCPITTEIKAELAQVIRAFYQK